MVTPWAPPGTFVGPRGMPRTRRARLQSSPTWLHTNWELLRTPSRRHVLQHQTATVTLQGDVSANGSVISFQSRFVNSFSTISACETTSAGRSSTSELLRAPKRPKSRSEGVPRGVSSPLPSYADNAHYVKYDREALPSHSPQASKKSKAILDVSFELAT